MTNFTTGIKKPKKLCDVETGPMLLTEWVKCVWVNCPGRRAEVAERPPVWAPSAPSAVSGVIKFDCGPDYHAWWGGVTPALQHRGFTLIFFPLLEVKEAVSDICVNKHTGVGPYHSETGGIIFYRWSTWIDNSGGDYWCWFSTWGNNEFAGTFYLYFIAWDLRVFFSPSVSIKISDLNWLINYDSLILQVILSGH